MTNSRVRLFLLLACVAVCVAWNPVIAGEHPWDADGGDRMDDYINQPNDPGSEEASTTGPTSLSSVESDQLESSSAFGSVFDRLVNYSFEWFYRIRIANDQSNELKYRSGVTERKNERKFNRFSQR